MRTILILCSVLVLAGCGGSSASPETLIQVEGFTFMLPKGYVAISSALVENKQLINKVIGSYKLPGENKVDFEPNIIFTRSDLPAELNFEQFATLNAQKMVTELAGYEPGTKEVVQFTCNNQDIQALLVFFRLKDPRYKAAPEVWMAQYQFIYQQKGYIVSAAYLSESDQQSFRSFIKTLGCVDSASSTLTGAKEKASG